MTLRLGHFDGKGHMVGHVYMMTPEDCWDLLRRREFGRLAYEISGEEALMSDQLRLRPWIKDAKNHVVAVDVSEISGRFFYLSKPWTHMMR